MYRGEIERLPVTTTDAGEDVAIGTRSNLPMGRAYKIPDALRSKSWFGRRHIHALWRRVTLNLGDLVRRPGAST